MATSVIIKDVDGHRLKLTATRLTQIDHSSTLPWYATSDEILRATKAARATGGDVPIFIHSINEDGWRRTLDVNFRLPLKNADPFHLGKIGCCYFDTKIFNRIIKTIRPSKTKKKAGSRV